MTLLIDKSCVHCKNVEAVAQNHPDIIKLYVENGMIKLEDGVEHPLDKKIPVLPALIVSKDQDCTVYCGEKFIMDFLNKTSQENN